MYSLRKIDAFARTYRHVGRYHQILRVLFKYGFGDLIELMPFEHYFEKGLQTIRSKQRKGIEAMPRPQRVRMALEELGPTFIKMGQILSTRADLIPAEYAEALSALQSQVTPFAFDEVRQIVESETGKPVDEIYSRFDETPIAAASLGQVHDAVLQDNGERVAVKVQRPDIQKTIETDLEILHHIATLSERHVEEVQAFRPVRVVEEFARSISRELDYLSEASHMERFREQFEGDRTVHIPRVHHHATTSRVLTMEFIEGMGPSDSEALRAAGYDPELLAKRGARMLLKMVFEHGFFHADPHPGNILILPDNVVGVLDFGMVGRVRPKDRQSFIELLARVVNRQDQRLVDGLLRLVDVEGEPDLTDLERDLIEFLDQHLYRSLEQLDLGEVLKQLLILVSKHQLRLKSDAYLMMRAVALADSLGRLLDPKFKIITEAEPFVWRAKMERLNPRTRAEELFESGFELLTEATDIPGEALQLIRRLREGRVKIQFEHHGLAEMRQTQDRVSNRVAYAIVLASLIVGSSLIVLSGVPPKFMEIPVIGLGGFLLAGVLGFWLLITILRHGKM